MTKINICNISFVNILLLILVILIVYGYFFNIKNNQITKIFENFQNEAINDINSEYNLVDHSIDIEEITDEGNIPMSRMGNYADGTWLTNKSEILNSNLINTMVIKIVDNGGTVDYMGKKFNINTLDKSVIKTNLNEEGVQLFINFLEFTNYNNLDMPYEPIPGLPRCIVYELNKDEDVTNKYVSLKLINGTNVNDLDPEIKRIIKYKIFDNKIPYLDYDVFTYRKIIGNYRYPFNTITSYEYNKSIDDKTKEYYLKNYQNNMAFSVKRTYKTANDKLVSTKMSQKFFLKLISGGSMLSKINLLDPIKEMEINGISQKFKPYSSTVYYYVLKDYNVKYGYGYPDKINSGYWWGSSNGLQNKFVSRMRISHDKLDTLEQVVASNFKIVKLNNFVYNSSNNNKNLIISLPF